MSDANRTQMLSGDPNRTMMASAPTLDPNKTMMGTAPTINATVTIKPIQCPVCKTFNPAGMMFCVDCGLIFDRALDGDAFGAPQVQVPVLLDQNGREYPLRPGTTVVGREADISLMDGKISRRHAQITSDGTTITFEDLGSTNGSKVNGAKVEAGQKTTLNGGDKISLGGFEVALQLPGGPGGNVTQAFGGNKTAAITVAPKKEVGAGTLKWNDQIFTLKAGINTLGRKSDKDICIPDPYVSGAHATIEITEDGIYLTDIGSTNGTMINDSKLSPNMRTKMGEADMIRIGAIELTISLA